ncbi:DnaJ domain-containing protein [Corallococcus coralloides DSM 2259]|uniref:DnaJ domain-containing protein n=1 Tax=Corallococcus coralloides (strain ATCC 25202 / DSM 2259 / NBRC 100086 / M2) TaxID=1144275 RepID=H8MEN1_CORCM|nr:J domain-containing protein [Corallococcus coralloides]AFE03558.1 DnaJ domain-containing protein [Corallococcus coralloides DSM 2259]
MQAVLYFSDKQVREKLFSFVDAAQGLLLVAGVRHGAAMTRPPQAREPFAALEDLFGHVLSQVIVADEGTTEGMWRDPLGDLGDRLYPEDKKRAYAAATGYVLLEGGKPRAVVRKHASPAEDLWFLQEALSRLSHSIPAPDPEKRPGHRRPEPAPRAPPRYGPASDSGAPEEPADPWRRSSARGDASSRGSTGARPGSGRARVWQADEATPPRGSRAVAAEPETKDPWTVLGIERGTPKDEARKAFRTLIAQYHPDKVAHLAPEFHALAERRTREILDAWEALERDAD